LLTRKLGEKYIRNPQVTVLITDQASKKIILTGLVNKPGTYQYQPGMTILELITIGGGFTPIAWKNRVSLTRVVDGQKYSIIVPVEDIGEGKAKNVRLRPGDIVSVPERVP